MERVDVGKKILSANERYALQNSQLLAEKKILCLNMISSPGSGKTTILARTCADLAGRIRIGVIEGDITTDFDAERIRETQAPAIQINTNGACHLSAQQVHAALGELPLDDLDIAIIENVGNLVCPSSFDLGEDFRTTVLSIPEGDDKPAKYPAMFQKSQVLLINKIDLAPYLDFSTDRIKSVCARLNPDLKIMEVSARSGEGIDAWGDFLAAKAKEKKERS